MHHCEADHTILFLEEKDAAELAELEAASFSTPWTEAQYAHILRHSAFSLGQIEPAGQGGLLASTPVFGIRTLEGKLVAYLCLGVHHAVQELEIYNIAVHADCKRQGLARWFLESVLRMALDSGVTRATLEVRAGNIPALALYAGLGFVPCGRRKKYYADTGEDALVLDCNLQARFGG